MKSNTHMQRILAALLTLNLFLTLCVVGYLAFGQTSMPESGILLGPMETTEKYILYIGTNDKDTYTQQIPTEEAREIVNRICAKYTDGYTGSDALGGWVDETGELTQEHTLVYEFYRITEAQLTNIMDEVREQLNQNSILVERQETVYTYYAGREEAS